METISSGIVAVPAGASSSGLYVIQEGVLQVLDEAWAQEIGLAEGGQAVVSGGGTLYLCTVSSGGTAAVLKSGYAQDVTVEKDGLYLVSSGGTAHKSLLRSGGSQIVYSEAAATGVTVMDGGVLDVSSGGCAGDPVVSQGGVLHAWAGALIDGARVSGTVEVHENAAANSVSVLDGGKLDVLAGGYACEPNVNSGGSLLVSSGATATKVRENGGYVYVAEGADVTFAPNAFSGLVLSDASATVHAGTTATDTTLNSGGRLHVFSGGVANIATVNKGGRLYVSSGGVANSATLYEGGVLHVSSGGTASGATVNDGGTLQVSSGGTAGGAIVSEWGMMNVYMSGLADCATVESAGRLYISSGGTASNTTVESAGYLYVSRGGTASGATVKSGGILYVSSGATMSGLAADSGASLNFYLAPGTYIAGTYAGSDFVIESGAVSHYTVNGNVSLYISSGCTADDITVNGGTLRLRSGAAANGVTVNGGALYVQSGGAATDIVWTPCEGHVYVYDGANATFVNEYSGVYFGSGNKLLSSATVMDGKTLDANFEMYVMNGGTADHTTVNSGGVLYVQNGGVADNASVNSSGSMMVSSGGTADHAAVNGGGSMTVSSGGTAVHATLNDNGRLYVSGGGLADSAAVNEGGSLYISSGGTADHAAVNADGVLNVYSGGTTANATVNSDGELNVSSSGTATGVTVNAGGSLYISSGGTADGATVNSRGLIYVCNGGTATSILENGGYVYVGIEEDVTFLPNTIGDLSLENTSASLHSGTTANSVTVNEDGRLQVRGGRADRITVNDGGVADVFSSSVVDHITVNTGGTLTVYNGAAITEILENGGYVDVNSKVPVTFISNTLSGLVLEDGRYATLHSNTSATGAVLNFDGGLYVRGGGADHTTVNDGGELMVSEGVADSTTLNSGGSAIVVRTGTAAHTTVHDGGNMLVSYGGKAAGVAVSAGGALEIGSGGSVMDAMVNDGGNMFVGSSGTATDISVSAGGRLELGDGGTVQSAVISSGGLVTGHVDCKDVTFDPGAILQFDLSAISPGNEIALVDLAGLAQSQNCPSFSLPVADSQAYGDYKLAEGAQGFEGKTISVSNSVMEFGSLSLDRSVVVGGREYALNLNGGDLVLSVNAAQPAQYVYLDFDGEEQVRYSNPDLKLSLDLSVADPKFSEEQRKAVVSALSEQYGMYNIAFTLERPVDAEYSTLYFGVTSAFDEYGDFFGVSEMYDGNDQVRNDNAFVLLDSAYSDDQVISVASRMLDHLMGFSWSGSVDGSPAILKYAESKALLSLSAGWIQRYPYNIYCPINPNTGDRCVVGCTNTAASQMIYYWLEKGLLDFTLTLTDSDAYRSNEYILIESTDDPESGHLSFAKTNELLQSFDILDKNFIAALCFAAGVVQKADYGSDETGTAWRKTLFVRSGFEKDEAVEQYAMDIGLDDYDIMEYELLHGRPVGVSLLKQDHAIVADGYDSSRDMFHLDFGWGNDSNRWYTREEIDDLRIYVEISGYTPAVSPDLTVKDLSAGEAPVKWKDDVTLSFTVSNEGREVSEETMAYVYCGDAILGACGIAYISPGYSREFTCTVNTASLKVGENVLTVKVGSQNGEGTVSVASVTVTCWDGDVMPQTQTWEKIEGAAQYLVEYSTDDFGHVIQLVADTNALDSYQLPEGKYQMRVKADVSDEWTVLEPVVAGEVTDKPKLVRSNADGNADVFYVNAASKWKRGYAAQHAGSADDPWGGTKEIVALVGRNKLTDVFEGSDDANTLLMTDDANGDALFVDDIYSASPNELGLSQSRIAQLDEIRAGAGDDIVDMTSSRFKYMGDGLTIRGGDGDDTVWANKGDNFLFGDAGNDRIVGASGGDVIAGGIGNDSMHGGGGNDVFTFCGNWGIDTAEQLAGGTVTLWFASGDESKWNPGTLTYTDGENSVTVTGVDSVDLKFGDDGSERFAALSSAGAFDAFTSRKIFEESGKGVLASL